MEGNSMKFLVIYEIEGKLAEPTIEIATEIFRKMDMADCYDIEIKRLILITGTELEDCKFRGVWHDARDPLKMEIRGINGNVVAIGYGTDH